MNVKIKVFAVQQLEQVLDACRKEAQAIADLCDSLLDEDFINMIMTSLFHESYYLSDEMKLVVGEDDALCELPAEI